MIGRVNPVLPFSFRVFHLVRFQSFQYLLTRYLCIQKQTIYSYNLYLLALVIFCLKASLKRWKISTFSKRWISPATRFLKNESFSRQSRLTYKGIINAYFYSHAVQISGSRGCSGSAVRNCIGACFIEVNLRDRNTKTPSCNLNKTQWENYHHTHL